MSSLDGLEHLVDGQRLLDMMSTLLERHDAVGVLSVPHVAHRDVAAKLLAGRWDYTRTGLLDDTHLRFYTRPSLTEALAISGLVPVDSDDVCWRRATSTSRRTTRSSRPDRWPTSSAA